jgi:FemAB-related protein (PEP-CTERM system-associated)
MIRALPDANGTWRSVVAGSNESNLAHSPEWFALIQRAYGHQPLYLCAEDDKSRSGVLPAFIVRRPFFGTVVTSMPFLDSGGPCTSSAAMARVLVAHLVAEARGIGAKLVEIRCSTPLDIGSQPAQTKVNMTLPIPSDPDRLWRQLDKAVRNQVRKAERSGLSIEIGGVENLPPFYETFAIRMRDLGSPVHAAGFLRAVLESFGSRARIILVRKGPTTVGGLVILAFKDRLIVPWATCLKEYFALCPNMLLYWVALRTACVEGFRRFDFGRSTRNSGTYHFKCQWGAREEPLFWYTIPVMSPAGPSTEHPGRRELFAKAWQHLPLGVTRYLGPRIRRYLVQ